MNPSGPGDAGGLLAVVAGPSGVGKGTVLARVLAGVTGAEISVSATTRPPRDGEVDGREYHFLSRTEFESRAEDGAFLEWAEFAGNLYGTPLDQTRTRVDSGAVVILEIEVQGAAQVRERAPDALLVFLAPPSMAELERRLRARGTESVPEQAVRLDTARWEMSQVHWFDHVVVNDDVDAAAAVIVALIMDRRRPVL